MTCQDVEWEREQECNLESLRDVEWKHAQKLSVSLVSSFSNNGENMADAGGRRMACGHLNTSIKNHWKRNERKRKNTSNLERRSVDEGG